MTDDDPLLRWEPVRADEEYGRIRGIAGRNITLFVYWHAGATEHQPGRQPWTLKTYLPAWRGKEWHESTDVRAQELAEKILERWLGIVLGESDAEDDQVPVAHIKVS